MRTLAIGDIHGCRTALECLLEAAAPAIADTVVTLGDYVDRGPDSRGVIDRLLRLAKETRLVPLKGNHEVMLEGARSGQLAVALWAQGGVGGDRTLASYGGSIFEGVPDSHWAFIESSLPFWETETHIFVHANLAPDLELPDQPHSILYWDRFDHRQPPHRSGKVVICGHTPQRSGVPVNLGHTVCIDTAACAGLWLTCLDVASGRYWQANEQGDLREDKLDPPGASPYLSDP